MARVQPTKKSRCCWSMCSRLSGSPAVDDLNTGRSYQACRYLRGAYTDAHRRHRDPRRAYFDAFLYKHAPGRMIWREDSKTILVLYDNGEWEQFEDTWEETQPEFTCGGSDSPPTPKRGFGKVWCTFSEVRQGLGEAISGETQGSNLLQEFEGGLLLTIDGTVLLLLSDSEWE